MKDIEITDEIRAAVYLELADDIDDHSLLSADNLRKRAMEKNRLCPDPGFVWIWYAGHDKPIAGIRDEDGTILAVGGVKRSIMKVNQARTLASDEVAVKIPPVSEWERGTDDIFILPIERSYYSDGHEMPRRQLSKYGITITRAEAERIEAEQ